MQLKLGTHGAIKSILFAQTFDLYEVTLSEFAQIKRVLFAHVYVQGLNIYRKISLSRQFSSKD